MKPGNLQDQSVKVPIPTDSNVNLEDKGRSIYTKPSSYKKRAFLYTLFLPRPVDLQAGMKE